MLSNPQVENSESIKAFLTKHQFSAANTYLLKKDTLPLAQKLLQSFISQELFFNHKGEALCYYDTTNDCSGVAVFSFIQHAKDSFIVCKDTTLQQVLENLVNLNYQPVSFKDLPQSDYYLVLNWQKFKGKRGYKDDITWIEEEIAKAKKPYTITLLKINGDMQEFWGLRKGDKAKLKIKVKGKEADISITNLPEYINQQ